MFKCVFDISHYLRIVAYMYVVVKAYQGIRLIVYSLDGLFGAYHERKHLGVAVCVVWFEVPFTDLPCTE